MKCLHCSNSAPQEIVASYSQVEDMYSDPHRRQVIGEAGPVFELMTCPACRAISLRRIDYCDWDDPDDWAVSWLFPQPGTPVPGLPPEVDKAYEAALKVRNIDSNAYAVLLGRVLDKICIDRGAEGRSLGERLKYLATQREIPEKLAEMARQLRQLRNIAAHADLGELSPKEVPILDALCKAILEYVYSAPQLIQEVQARIDGNDAL